MADYDHLCLGCMGDKGSETVCPHCGWVVGTKAEAPQHLPPGTILHEKYLLGRVLGHGGFGITYLAWDMNLDMKLAIKEYMPRDFATRSPEQTNVSAFSGELSTHFESGLRKFLDEAKTIAQFNNHPGIVGVRDFFRENGTAYLVMYYLEGIDFKQYLESQGGKIPFQTALMIMMPVMDALREVHRTGTLHRDISPDNIYITKEGQVKVLDFGAARHALTEFSKSISVILKPGYAPEEQYRSKGKQGPWTDVYATAATLYRAICGHVPPESLDRLAEDTIMPPSKLGVEIPVRAENALLKALSVKAADRYQSMEELQAELFENTDEFVEDVHSQISLQTSTETETVVSNVDTPTIATFNEKPTVALGKNLTESQQPQPKKGLSMWVWIGGGAAAAIILAVAIIGSIFLFGDKAGDDPKKIDDKKDEEIVNDNDPEPNTPPPVQQVAVPDVTNTLEVDANTLLQEQGLVVGQVKYVEDRYAPKGLVLKQSVQPDQKVDEKTTVDLEIANGIALSIDETTIEAENVALLENLVQEGKDLESTNKEEALTNYLQAREVALYLLEKGIEPELTTGYLGTIQRYISLVKLDLGYHEYALFEIEASVRELEYFLETYPNSTETEIANQELAISNGEQSYIQILNKQYDAAIDSALESLKVYKDDLIFNANLAHAYLFTDQYADAVNIYTLYMHEMLNDSTSFKDFVISDFALFRRMGITHPDMQKVEDMFDNVDTALTDEEEIQFVVEMNGFYIMEEDVEGYMSTISPNAPSYENTKAFATDLFEKAENFSFVINSFKVLEITGDTAQAEVDQTLSYTIDGETYESTDTIIYKFVRADETSFYKWLYAE